MSTKELRRWLWALRKRFPLDRKLRVIREDNKHAYTSSLKSGYLISLPRGASADATYHMLIHEWAHCRVWKAQEAAPGQIAHDVLFAVEYEQIYRWAEREKEE